jgi:hypothetical protein
MCDAKFTLEAPPLLLNGPASQAVERSSKRQRLSTTVEEPLDRSAFTFNEIFNSVGGEDEFPAIKWESETTEESSVSSCSMSSSSSVCPFDEESSLVEGSSPGRKRGCTGMLRSKSIRADLSMLTTTTNDDILDDIEVIDITSMRLAKKLDKVLIHLELPQQYTVLCVERVSVAGRAC